MKIGDLVRLLQEEGVLWANQDIPPDSLGIVVEEPGSPVFQKGGAFPQMWVQWNGRWDWDSMLVEDLEIISASR
tara:strand:+ start:866 stop:1087 length:222 start_codon:yes stop_codon:yes gene_type:complete